MPLNSKKEVHEYTRPPKNLEANEEVFLVRFTQECFRKYEDYLQCIEKYRDRTWICEITGKTCLTFEEALLCEKRAIKKAHDAFPSSYLPQLVSIVHQSSLSLDALADQFHELYNKGFVLHEQANAKVADSKPFPVQIVSLDPPYQCKILPYEGTQKDHQPGSTCTLEATQLTKQPVPKSIVRGKIRGMAIKTHGGPWIITDEKVAAEFNLVIDIPQDALHPPHEHSGSESEDSDTDKPKKKKPRPSPQSKVKDSLVPDELLEHTAEQAIPLGSSDFLIPQQYLTDAFACWAFVNNFSNVLRVTPFTLEEFQDALSSNETGPVLDNLFDGLLKVIGKKSSHSKSWEDNIKSFLSREVEENIPKSPLPTNQADSDSDSQDSDHSSTQRELDMSDTPSPPLLDSDIIERLKAKGFHKLEVGDKLAIIKYLCDEAIESERVRIEVDKRVETSIELDKEKRTADQQHRKVIKQLQQEGQSTTSANTSYKKAVLYLCLGNLIFQTDEFEAEKNRNRTRLTPLGQDRHHNQYWYFANRLFVEVHSTKQWHYYASKADLEHLVRALDDRGVREAPLKNAITKRFDKMVADINRRHLQLLQQEPGIVRRSERRKAATVTTERLEETALQDAILSDDDYLDYDDEE